jgi:hypothetical protein
MPPKLLAPPEEAEEGACDLDFGTVPVHLIDLCIALARCMNCGHLVAAHTFTLPAPAAGVVLQMPQRSGEEKKLHSLQESQAIVRTFKSGYRHDFTAAHSIDVARSFRHADAGHLGLLGCPSLVTGDLPERPPRHMLLTPWERAVLFALVLEAICLAIKARIHLQDVGDPVARVGLFSDCRANAPDFTYAEALEVIRGLSAMAVGLRASSIRDPILYARIYAGSKVKLIHPIVGAIHWMIFQRTVALDRLRPWVLALCSGLPLPSWEAAPAPAAAPAAAAAAAAPAAAVVVAAAAAARCVVDLTVWGRQWPWIGLGEAIVTDMGQASSATAAEAWEKLESSEALVSAALKVLHPEGYTEDAPTPLDTAGGGGAAAKKRKRAESQRLAAAAALATAAGLGAGSGGMAGGGGGGRGGRGGRGGAAGGGRGTPPLVSAARMAAKTRVAAKALDDVDKTDCLDAGLCFKCKKERHDGATACTLRGKAL